MGPYPHNTEAAEISEANPIGTNGVEFIEFAHEDPKALGKLFSQMGYVEVARHKARNIQLYRQGGINYMVNGEKDSFAAKFAKEHGPSAPSMAWRVVDAQQAFDHAVNKGAKPYTGDGKALDVPAIYGIGNSLLYFVDQYEGENTSFDQEFNWIGEHNPKPKGFGFHYFDHLTNNVFRGNMDKWYGFYRDLFNFREIRFFDIEGKLSGLLSRALTSPCGKIRIPVNESTDDVSQIEEFLKDYNGEGIQHIAVGTDDIYDSVEKLSAAGIKFMPPPPDIYYENSKTRVTDHEEPIEALKKHGILIDGEGVVDGGTTRILLQIFSQTVIGPIFFEFIQRKGDDGFGEGNFKALFESIEQDQIDRGVLKVEVAQ